MSFRCHKSTGGLNANSNAGISSSKNSDISMAGLLISNAEFGMNVPSPHNTNENSSDTNDSGNTISKQYEIADGSSQGQVVNDEIDGMGMDDYPYATMDGGGRSLRRRTSRPDFKNFLEDFDPGKSEREIRKRKKKEKANPGIKHMGLPNIVIGSSISYYRILHP